MEYRHKFKMEDRDNGNSSHTCSEAGMLGKIPLDRDKMSGGLIRTTKPCLLSRVTRIGSKMASKKSTIESVLMKIIL